MRLISVLLLICLCSVVYGIYTHEEIKEVFDYLQAVPIEHEINRLKIRDFFVLADKEVPAAYVSYDGSGASYQLEQTQTDSVTYRTYSKAAEILAAAAPSSLNASLPSHLGLNQDCSDKLCNMMEYLLVHFFFFLFLSLQ
jgi:hypothetical protein